MELGDILSAPSSFSLLPPVWAVRGAPCPPGENEKNAASSCRSMGAGVCLCPGLPVVTPLLLMKGQGGWGTVPFPVVDFQESTKVAVKASVMY